VFSNGSGLNQLHGGDKVFTGCTTGCTTAELNVQRLSGNEPNEAVLVPRLGSQGQAIRVVIWRRAR